MADINVKLQELKEAVGSSCSVHFDGDLDRWIVWHLRRLPNDTAVPGFQPHREVRETLGCGRCREDAIDAACRKVNIEPLKPDLIKSGLVDFPPSIESLDLTSGGY